MNKNNYPLFFWEVDFFVYICCMEKYSKEWQKYDHDYGYDKKEYDIKVYSGETVYNCYPNAGKFLSFNKATNGHQHEEKNILEIRLSHTEVLNIND